MSKKSFRYMDKVNINKNVSKRTDKFILIGEDQIIGDIRDVDLLYNCYGRVSEVRNGIVKVKIPFDNNAYTEVVFSPEELEHDN